MEKLNKEQLEAVMHKDGPLLIVAGAGTGKTAVITQRIAYLIEQNHAKTDEILALTFTEKAAGEMEERVDRLLPFGYLDLWISTFHSFGEKILKAHGLDIGLPADFKLLNEFGQYSLIKKNFNLFDLDYYRPLGNPNKFIRALLSHFSRLKDEDISTSEYLNFAEELRENCDSMLGGGKKRISNSKFLISNLTGIENKEGEIDIEIAGQEVNRIYEVANAYHTYEQVMLENSCLDFGDLINYTLKLFRERPGVLKKYRDQFKFIMLDEFQDTNWAQYELVKLLSGSRKNLVVVGDDDQSIYKFRGASVSNIIQFKEDFPEAKQIFINKNYRNKQEILDMSYEFIKQNDPNRLEFRLNKESGSSKSKKIKFSKKLEAQIPGKGIIELIKGDDLQDEVKKVIEKIADIKISEKEVNFSDFAILVRANNSAKDFSNALEEAGLPYQFLSSRGLYSKPIVMDIISYFKLLDDYHESSAMYRVLNIPVFGFSYQDIIKINYAAKKKAWSLFTAFKTMNGKLGAEMAKKTNFLIKLIDKHSNLAKEKSASELFLAFMEESGYLKHVSGLKESRSRENLSYLNSFMKRIKAFEVLSDDKSVKAFIEELNIEIEAGEEGALPVDPDSGPDSIKIMTIHSAKGLEFKYVFLPNMVDKKFPTIERRDPIDIPDALVKENVPEGDIHTEEERRLFYVAATRAKTGLYLSWAPDYGGLRMKKPSRFLIEAGLVSNKDINQDKKKKNEENLLVSNKKSFKEDEKIEYKLPFYLSFSQLSCFSDCPYKYRFSYILKIPSRGKHFFSFGETMHNVLQKTFELVKERSGLVQNDLFSASKTNKKASSKNILDIDIKLEEMLEIYKNCWIEDWYQNEEQKQAYKKSGKRIIKDFHKIHNKKWPETVLLEKGFNLKIEADDGAYSLRGRIDRVDKIDDKVKIVDYKTGNPKEKLMPNDKYQLLIYQMALEDLFREEVKALSFYYLENNSEVEFLGSEKEISAVKDKIRKAIREINKGEFPPKPGPLCAFCDYKDICEYRK